MSGRRRKPEFLLQIVRERIAILFGLAESEARTHPQRSKRYVQLARRLASRYNIRLGSLKRKFCKKCNALWVPGRNVRVRVASRERCVTYECECGTVTRFPYAREKARSKHI